MEETRALFRDAEATQFVIVTIPTAMAAAESARLAKALLQQQVLPVLTARGNRASDWLQRGCLCPCRLSHWHCIGLACIRSQRRLKHHSAAAAQPSPTQLSK